MNENENEDDDESIFLFFSRQRDQILLDIEKRDFEINAQYFIIKDLISAYKMM
jgi:hypothetical protein